MNEKILQDIIKGIENPRYGIAIKDESTQDWLLFFSTKKKLQELGYDSVEECLAYYSSLGYDEITVYLKKPNGTSTVFVPGKKVLLQKPKDSPTPTPPVQQQQQQALHMPHQTQDPMHFMQNQGMNMPMPQGMNMFKMYSDSERLPDLQKRLDVAEHQLREEKSKREEAERKLMRLELKSELGEKSGIEKTTAALEPFAQMLLELKTGATPQKTPLGLNKSTNLSEIRTELINKISSDDFDETYCLFLQKITNKLNDENQPFIASLVKLINENDG